MALQQPMHALLKIIEIERAQNARFVGHQQDGSDRRRKTVKE
jgi:hypothetical protein